ncbi:MAG: ABC transporter ATP-binding protein [Rickettsiales bacterium]|nr:ABC transporter ATP-binding protein [Pseudomonadota bacterium]MDA0965640.1 ABC transporter ATP-binding protein [Pseudomonadota bacterium]MDG4542964.1 ABC transporter ATP-binding protein [Rickettsiales bacterium]MDG4544588.1 ABC transporter ATP-binding protein [Rickettsiales bacterium]MDG4546710.1 ABC transporter ATP-binding protein [Rickettsiales bacterium]
MRKDNLNIISLSNVSLTLKGPSGLYINILQQIDMNVQSGDFISVTGASGSGKTSLMMLISGVEKATSGKIEVAGKELQDLDEDELAAFRRDNIGIVFQNFHLIPTMTAFENVEVALELAGIGDAAKIAKNSLKEVGLQKRTDHYPDQLSGGEQQRVALARAFATCPKILLADEPTGNLDSENGKIVTDLLLQMKDNSGTTLLLITHDPKLAEMSSRKFVMQDGKINEKK